MFLFCAALLICAGAGLTREEMAKFGDVEQIYICENLGDHLIGNVYVKFFDENDAALAVAGLAG